MAAWYPNQPVNSCCCPGDDSVWTWIDLPISSMWPPRCGGSVVRRVCGPMRKDNIHSKTTFRNGPRAGSFPKQIRSSLERSHIDCFRVNYKLLVSTAVPRNSEMTSCASLHMAELCQGLVLPAGHSSMCENVPKRGLFCNTETEHAAPMCSPGAR
jgi:hypothetical protein